MTSFAILRRCRSIGYCLRRCYPQSRAIGIFRSIENCRHMNSACCRESDDKSLSRSGTKLRPRLILPPVLGDEFMELVGASHGWLAVFNKRSNDLFLSDPLSHRRINLPPFHTLPHHDFIFDLDGRGSVSKVILSSSPEDDECRAMMSFGPANSLAFCLPGRSSEWTPIGDRFFDLDVHRQFDRIARVHEDLVYCRKRKVFTSITAAHLDLPYLGFETYDTFNAERCDWDVEDPNHPKLVRSHELVLELECEKGKTKSWLEYNRELLDKECIQIPHLAYAEESDRLFLALRFVRLMKEEEDGESPLGFVPTCEVRGLSGYFPGKTVGFIAVEVDDSTEESSWGQRCLVLEDLKGMSMFVGINHSYAISISISEHDEFKPNSIYFSDAKRIQRVCGVNDHGVFDYATKTVSPVVLVSPNQQSFKASPSPSSHSPFWFT